MLAPTMACSLKLVQDKNPSVQVTKATYPKVDITSGAVWRDFALCSLSATCTNWPQLLVPVPNTQMVPCSAWADAVSATTKAMLPTNVARAAVLIPHLLAVSV